MLRSHTLPVLLLFGSFFILSFQTLSPTVSPAVNDAEAPLRGAWMLVQKDNTTAKELQIQMVKILSNGHFMFAFYNDQTQQFFSAGGGTYQFENGKYTETIAFHTIDPGLAGRSLTFDVKLEGDNWIHSGMIDGTELNEVFTRIDDGSGSELIGTWVQESFIDENGKLKKLPRNNKKLKILSASRFQWVEYNGKNGKFVAAGGGEYSLNAGNYSEKLHFFSDDSTMVGSSIPFNCEYTQTEWKHQEKSSRGETMLGVNEIWSRSDW